MLFGQLIRSGGSFWLYPLSVAKPPAPGTEAVKSHGARLPHINTSNPKDGRKNLGLDEDKDQCGPRTFISENGLRSGIPGRKRATQTKRQSRRSERRRKQNRRAGRNEAGFEIQTVFTLRRGLETTLEADPSERTNDLPPSPSTRKP